MDPELLKLIGQGGVGVLSVGILVVLGKVVWKVGLKMVAAIDRMIDKLDSHTKTDVEAWAQVNAMIHQNSKETATQVAELFREVTQTLESLRQSMTEQLGAIQQDLAVLSARVDTAMELTPLPPTPVPDPPRFRRARTEPGQERVPNPIPGERSERKKW